MDLEAVSAQEPEPIAVAEMELDAAAVGAPVEVIAAKLRPHQLLLDTTDVWTTQDQQGGVPQEDQAATRSQQARSFWNPAVRIGPDGCAILGYDQVKSVVRER